MNLIQKLKAWVIKSYTIITEFEFSNHLHGHYVHLLIYMYKGYII